MFFHSWTPHSCITKVTRDDWPHREGTKVLKRSEGAPCLLSLNLRNLNGLMEVRRKEPNLAFTSQSNTIVCWKISETFVIKANSPLDLKSGCFCRSAVLQATVTEGSSVTQSLSPLWVCVMSSKGHDWTQWTGMYGLSHFMWSIVWPLGLPADSNSWNITRKLVSASQKMTVAITSLVQTGRPSQ